MMTRARTVDGHLEQFTVSDAERGWTVSERHDDRVVRTKVYSDWHRVERAVRAFELRDRPSPADH